MNILDSIDKNIHELKVTSIDISFNELADMYDEGELIISPDYQRTFRWDVLKQSRFIETLLLEMPVPPIYAIEIDDGKYELIDGLQRISSYLSFRGMLKDISNDLSEESAIAQEEVGDEEYEEEIVVVKNNFILDGCDIITELNGMTYNDLPASLKIKTKRAFVTLKVLRKGINPQMKYHMFKRLNTGGEKLSYQEVRNCSIRLIDAKFIDFINRIAKNKDFQETLKNVSGSQLKKKFAEELALRFFAFKNQGEEFIHDIDKFLTGYMEDVAIADSESAPIFDYDKETVIFENTFKWLNQSMGSDSFAVYKGTSSKLTGFNVYQYEAITIGIQSVYEDLDSGHMSFDLLKSRLLKAKKDKELKSATIGGGKNSSGVYRTRVDRVVRILGESDE